MGYEVIAYFDTGEGGPMRYGTGGWGHAWLEVRAPDRPPLWVGYWPAAGPDPLNRPGVLDLDDRSHLPSVDHVEHFQITEAQYRVIMLRVHEVEQHPQRWDAFENNCTTFVVQTLREAGISMPDPSDDVSGYDLSHFGFSRHGDNPASAVEHLTHPGAVDVGPAMGFPPFGLFPAHRSMIGTTPHHGAAGPSSGGERFPDMTIPAPAPGPLTPEPVKAWTDQPGHPGKFPAEPSAGHGKDQEQFKDSGEFAGAAKPSAEPAAEGPAGPGSGTAGHAADGPANHTSPDRPDPSVPEAQHAAAADAHGQTQERTSEASVRQPEPAGSGGAPVAHLRDDFGQFDHLDDRSGETDVWAGGSTDPVLAFAGFAAEAGGAATFSAVGHLLDEPDQPSAERPTGTSDGGDWTPVPAAAAAPAGPDDDGEAEAPAADAFSYPTPYDNA